MMLTTNPKGVIYRFLNLESNVFSGNRQMQVHVPTEIDTQLEQIWSEVNEQRW